MKHRTEKGTAASDLRRMAEERLKKLNEVESLLAGKDPMALIHELTVHQIELEMQNEELRRTRDDAEEAREYARELYDFAPVGYFTIDPHYVIRELNFAAASLLGRERSLLTGRNLLHYVAREDRPEFGQSINRSREIQEKVSFESRLIDADEKPLFVQVEAVASAPNEGYRVAVLDITRHRELESQLRHVQKMEALGTLTGGIAHEFNNIMTAVIVYSSFLKSKLAGDEALSPRVEALLGAAERAAQLVRSLLSFSRKQGCRLKPLGLNDLISREEELLKRIIREDIHLCILQSDRPLKIRADRNQIEQLLVNLAKNSQDAMPNGGVITISTRPVVVGGEFAGSHGFGRPGSYAVIEFADDGEGMDEETRRKIFDPFFTTKEVGKGTGLGLSICYSIIKQHDGYIICESEPGKGTTFKIYFPLLTSDKSEPGGPGRKNAAVER